MGHEHVSRVKVWGMNEDYQSTPKMYDCRGCGEESETPFREPENASEHSRHTVFTDGCFGCKAHTLQLATGDASGGMIASGWTNKRWDSELQTYRDARAEGIQPNGTSRFKVEAARDASDMMGSAYNAETMPQANQINKPIVEVMKEIGQV